MTLFFFSLFYTPVHRGLHPAILPSFTVMATKQCSVLCHPEKASQALLQSDPIVTPSKMLPQCSPLPLKAGDAAEQQNEQAWRERRYTGSHGGMAKIFLAQLKIDPEEKKKANRKAAFCKSVFLGGGTTSIWGRTVPCYVGLPRTLQQIGHSWLCLVSKPHCGNSSTPMQFPTSPVETRVVKEIPSLRRQRTTVRAVSNTRTVPRITQ